MTVQQLIDILSNLPNKSLSVTIDLDDDYFNPQYVTSIKTDWPEFGVIITNYETSAQYNRSNK